MSGGTASRSEAPVLKHIDHDEGDVVLFGQPVTRRAPPSTEAVAGDIGHQEATNVFFIAFQMMSRTPPSSEIR